MIIGHYLLISSTPNEIQCLIILFINVKRKYELLDGTTCYLLHKNHRNQFRCLRYLAHLSCCAYQLYTPFPANYVYLIVNLFTTLQFFFTTESMFQLPIAKKVSLDFPFLSLLTHGRNVADQHWKVIRHYR